MIDRASVRLKIFPRFLDIAKNLSRITFPVKKFHLRNSDSFGSSWSAILILRRRIVFELFVGWAIMGFDPITAEMF